jgi:hypothetical protein
MAKMYPERLPEGLASDAEYDLFGTFEQELDERFTVYAGVKWLLKGRQRGAFQGEADFIIVHPDRGLLVLEVKGGEISRDGATGQWHSVDRYGSRHAISDPIEQARRNSFALVEKLAEAPATAGFSYPIGHAIALPNARLKHVALGLDAPDQIILDQDDFGAMQKSIERVTSFVLGDRQTQVGTSAIRALTQVISPTWEIQVALKAQLREERERFRTLTEEQFFLLDMLAGHRRALVDGCAGSGKTFLAVEKARRLANEGFDTLLTCFNRNLAASIRDSLDPMPPTLRVQHFHELAYEFVEQAGIANAGPGDDSNLYFKETLPTLLLDAVDRLTDRFDAIVVDEGQDFQGEWWVPLESLLRDTDSIWYVFYDGQQNIYTDGMTVPFESEPHFLPVNLRNTKAIHRLIEPYYAGRPIQCRGPEGRPPKTITTANPEVALRLELHRLVNEEGIPGDDIVILTGVSQRRSGWKEGLKVGNLSLTWDAQPGANQIRVATVHSFKGLERPVVIVTEMDSGTSGTRHDHLRLVACSRASSDLILIEPA